MEILVRSPNWIGDAVLALPAIRALKKNLPQSRLTVLCQDHLADVFSAVDDISHILPFPSHLDIKSGWKLVRELRRSRYDAGILFTNSFSSALLFALANVHRRTGYATDCRSLFLDRELPPPAGIVHQRDYYLQLSEFFLGTPLAADYPYSLPVTAEEKLQGHSLLITHGIPRRAVRVGMAPGAAYGPAKAWPAPLFRALIERLCDEFPEVVIVIFGSQAEQGLAEELARGKENRVHNLCGKLPLRQSIILISLCRFFIANDSGLMHVAAALNVPGIAIFGPTPLEKSRPTQAGFRVLHHPVACAPCRHRQCPSDHRCMTAVTGDEVFQVARQALAELTM